MEEKKENPDVITFDVCKACGDKRTIMGEKMKGKTDLPTSLAYYVTALAAERPLAGVPIPGTMTFIDGCFKCGTIRVIRQEPMLIPPQQPPPMMTGRQRFTGVG